jgi:hypothetical protein
MTYDTKNLCHNTQSNTIIFDGEHKEKTLSYLTILNSKVLWFFLAQTGNILRGGYFRFKTKYLEPFHLPDLTSPENKDIAESLSDFADTMLSLNSQLQDKRSRFLRRLSDNLEGVKITTALQTFDTMDFKGFVAELKKQKIKLSLSQQDEWEEYFNKRVAECRELSAQIKATDEEIDNRVFDLYGLTEEERKIVMEA